MEMFLPATKNLLSEKNHGEFKWVVRMQLLAHGETWLSYRNAEISLLSCHSYLLLTDGQLVTFLHCPLRRVLELMSLSHTAGIVYCNI